MAVPEHRDLPEAPPIVLIVEDDRDTRELYEAVFKLEGFWVTDAADAESAFEQASDLQPDVVITDVGLPGRCDGVGLANRIHALAKTANIPVIAVSGRNVAEIAEAGFTEVLQKPVSPDVLIAAARRVLAASGDLRRRGEDARERIAELRQKSARLSTTAQRLRRQVPRPKP